MIKSFSFARNKEGVSRKQAPRRRLPLDLGEHQGEVSHMRYKANEPKREAPPRHVPLDLDKHQDETLLVRYEEKQASVR